MMHDPESRFTAFFLHPAEGEREIQKRDVRSALAAPFLALVALLAIAGCSDTPSGTSAETTNGTSATEIAWRDGDVSDAFAEAAEQNKPILLYWGALWCPPCNQLKAGLFRDANFIARTQDFIPVYLDGDSKGAQAWGERFKIQGYPTLIVLRPDLTEVTRLTGSGEPSQVIAALEAVRKGSANVEELLARALKEPGTLSADDWSLIAGYGGWRDDKRFGPTDQLLAKLATTAPNDALKRQFFLQALIQRPDTAPTLTAPERVAARKALEAVLASPEEQRANRTILTWSAVPLVNAATTTGAERDELAGRLTTALDGFYKDEKLGVVERLSPLDAEIALFRNKAGEKAAPPAALVKKVRERVNWASETAKSPYERQALISTAAHLLAQIDDLSGAEKLLKAELPRSQAPYYYMPSLAELAEQRGDKSTALDWLKQGYEQSEGPASRVQWGVLYVQGLIRLTPDDKPSIEKATSQVLGELAGQPDSYHQRTRRRLEELGKNLTQWSQKHDGAATLIKLRTRTNEVCAGQGNDRILTDCRNWLGTA